MGRLRNGVRSGILPGSPPPAWEPVGGVRQGNAAPCQRKSQWTGPARSQPREIFHPRALAVAIKSRACVKFPLRRKVGKSVEPAFVAASMRRELAEAPNESET